MNPGEQGKHRTAIERLDRRIDDLALVSEALDRRITGVVKYIDQQHAAVLKMHRELYQRSFWLRLRWIFLSR